MGNDVVTDDLVCQTEGFSGAEVNHVITSFPASVLSYCVGDCVGEKESLLAHDPEY